MALSILRSAQFFNISQMLFFSLWNFYFQQRNTHTHKLRGRKQQKLSLLKKQREETTNYNRPFFFFFRDAPKLFLTSCWRKKRKPTKRMRRAQAILSQVQVCVCVCVCVTVCCSFLYVSRFFFSTQSLQYSTLRKFKCNFSKKKKGFCFVFVLYFFFF